MQSVGMKSPSLSVVVPVYGCKDSLIDLVSRIVGVASGLTNALEVVLVDDYSLDGGWTVIKNICEKYSCVRGIRLSRNFGQHIAIMAGFRASTGKIVVVMDCDLQDPPELIPVLVQGTERYPVSIGVRHGDHQSLVRRLQSRLFRKVFATSTGISITRELTSFAALRRTVVDEYIKFSEADQHFLHVLSWLGFEQWEIPYERPQRHSGSSSYTFRSRLRHALHGLFFETSRVLYVVATIGVAMAAVGFVGVAYVLWRVIVGQTLLGWPSTISAVVLFGGASIAIQSVIGIYVAKNFQQSKGRPLYVVSEIIN